MTKTIFRTVWLLGIWSAFATASVVAQQRSFDEVSKVAEQVRQELGAPGLSIAMAIDDKLIWSSGFGLADIENAVPARGNTVYRIASISKTFGATAVFQLVDRGQVSVNDTIEKYVPSFHHPVLLRQILTHTSGIRHYKSGEGSSTVHYDSLAEAIKIFKDDPLTFPPGTNVLYSSYAFNLLQGVIETTTGKPLEAYLSENIFKPAGMTETFLEYPERIVAHRARGYEREQDSNELRNAPYVDNSIKWLGGGLISSAEDLIRYHIALNTGKLVRPESLKQMNTPSTLQNGTAIDYSLGWETSTDDKGNRFVDKYGSGTGVSTYLLRIPDKHFALGILVNLGNKGNIKPFARRIAYAALNTSH